MRAVTGLIRTMRPRQWTKNVLFVFPALVFDGQIFSPEPFARTLLACILLILMSGTVYIINDLVDIERDRQHPRKKDRPLPSGQLPIQLAVAAAIIIPLITLIAAQIFEPRLAFVLVLYLAIQLAYSFYLKHIVIIDVLTVTSGFVLRVLAGVAVIQVTNFSPWLYACTGLLALFLVVGKRRQELVKLGADAIKTRPIFKEYNLPLLDEMLRLVTTSTFITYLLYTVEAKTVIHVAGGVNLTLITVPIVLYGLFHYLYLIHIKGDGGAPEEILLTDRRLQLTVVIWGLTFVFLIYVLPRIVQL